jgi:DNA-binding GntR family transcriptional regulator
VAHPLAAAKTSGIIIHNYEFKTQPDLRIALGSGRARILNAPSTVATVETQASAVMNRRPLYLDVAERLRQQIFARALEPGCWIDEMKLCADFGISRTPLREALKVLAVEGLVTMKPRRGAYVTEMSRDDVEQIYRLLALLEADAAAHVAAAASDEEIAELRGLHDRLEKQTRHRDAFFAANEAFHMRLLALGRNRWREQIVADLRKVMKLNRHHSLFKRGRLAESLAEHRALMDAIEARDAAGASRLMHAHFRSGLDAAS